MIDDLRSYQIEAVESAYQNLTVEDHAGTLVVMATGTGKTRILAAIAERWFREKGQRVLLLAHRRKLVHQLRKGVVALTDFKDWELCPEHRYAEYGASRALFWPAEGLKSADQL